ncbi:MAG TPA: phytoene desaturase family protein [Acidimicrobiia bacterium]|nr:phytoene desaturase family protein [Acidimicrobiia bacterium]
MSRVAIIGAGLGGLSAAAHVVSQGHDVTIFESLSRAGGRAAREIRTGPLGTYSMEFGPTVFTMLDVAKEPFDALGVNMETLCPMIKLDPAYRAKFSDGTELNWPADPSDLSQTISDFAGGDASLAFEKYQTWLGKLYVIEYPTFISRNYSRYTDLLSSSSQLIKLMMMGGFRSMESKVSRFISDERLRTFASFQSLYAGVTPSQARAIYCIISYMDLIQGVYFPRGGMSAYPEALAEALGEAGVKIHFNSEVNKVLKIAEGFDVFTNGGSERFDAVVCNADLPESFSSLFDLEMPKRVQRARYSPSCLLYIVAGKANIAGSRAHHTITFSADSKQNFTALVRDRTLMNDPSYLISNPTFSDPSMVPQGREMFYVLEPCPHLDSNVDFVSRRDELQERMKHHLVEQGISLDVIDEEMFFDPTDWEQQGMYRGTPFSLAHTFFQSGPFRPRNYLKKLPGVFFCGTGTTPGVGIPMVLESGKLAADRVAEYCGSDR